MRNFRTFGENFSLDPAATQPSGSSGGALTFTTYNRYTGLDDNDGSGLTSSSWTVKTSMNLIRFEMSGGWYFIDLSPLYIELLDDSYNVLAQLEITSSGGDYQFWTGSVPILAETFLWCNVYGGGQLAGEDFYNAICVDLCVTAWFDGEAGGGLLLYPNQGS